MIRPRDLLDLAADLVGGPGEAHWRAGASRAYYAAFHAARELLIACRFVVPQADRAHAYLALRLENCGHPDLEQAGSDLGTLRQWRNRADYDLPGPFAQADAFDLVQTALGVVQLLESVPTVPTVQAAVTQAMRDYERDVLQDVTWQP